MYRFKLGFNVTATTRYIGIEAVQYFFIFTIKGQFKSAMNLYSFFNALFLYLSRILFSLFFLLLKWLKRIRTHALGL